MEIEEYRLAPAMHYTHISGETTEMVQGTDGTVAWTIVDDVPDVLIGDRRADALREAAIDGSVRWRDLFRHAECEGTVDFTGHRCHKVVVIPQAGTPRTRYYDVETGYLLGEEMTVQVPKAAAQTVAATFGDYRQYGDIMVPTRHRVRAGMIELEARIEQVEINPELLPEMFAVPKPVELMLVAMPGYQRNLVGRR